MARRSQMNTLFSNIPVKDTYKKRKIPVAIREAVWIKHCGRVFEHKCLTSWCPNTITAFDFQCGHNIPESKGGSFALTNLYPLCSRCNLSMGNTYTFDQWNAIKAAPKAVPEVRTWRQHMSERKMPRFFSCFSVRTTDVKAETPSEPPQPAPVSKTASQPAS